MRLLQYLGRAAMLPALFLFTLANAADQANDLALQSQRAHDMMAAGRFDEAIPIYKQLVKAVPGNPGLLFNLGLAEHMAGQERDAIPNFEAVLKMQPKLLPALVSLGAAHMALNEPHQAVAPLRQAVALAPADRNARGMLADALMADRRFDDASEQYRKLTELAPDDPRAWYGLGMSYQSLAGAAFDALRKADPQSPYVSALIADTRVQRQQFRSAFYFYREALKQMPNLHGVHGAMAELYRKTGHPDWAAAEDAKERNLPAPDCKSHPSECQFLGGHDLQALDPGPRAVSSPEMLFWQTKAANELALQAFFQLGQLPPSAELHKLKAEIARNRNQLQESVKEWRAALELTPHDPGLQQELAISLFMAQNYREAIEEAAGLLKKNPRSPELNFLTGDSYEHLEQPEKAVPYLRAALAADPKLLAADASLGLALVRMGKSAEAVPHLEKAQALDDDGSLHYQLARAYQASGETEKARTAMAGYQAIVKKNQDVKEELERETQITAPPG